jgi:Cu2+-containing amine oxidase
MSVTTEVRGSKAESHNVAVAQRYGSDRQIAAIYDISVRTLRKWRLSGVGPRHYHLGKSVRYDLSETEEYFRSTATGGGSLVSRARRPIR